MSAYYLALFLDVGLSTDDQRFEFLFGPVASGSAQGIRKGTNRQTREVWHGSVVSALVFVAIAHAVIEFNRSQCLRIGVGYSSDPEPEGSEDDIHKGSVLVSHVRKGFETATQINF